MSSVLYDVPGPKARRVSLIGSVIGVIVIGVLLVLAVMTLAQQGIFEGRRWAIFGQADVWTLIANGIGATLSAAAVSAVIAFPLGLVLCLMRISDVAWIRIPTRIVLEFLRRMLPSLVAQLVVLLKDTSLGYIVAYGELLRAVQVMADFLGPQFLFPVFFVAAAIYIAINLAVSRIAIMIEKRGSKKAAGGMAHVPVAGTAPAK